MINAVLSLWLWHLAAAAGAVIRVHHCRQESLRAPTGMARADPQSFLKRAKHDSYFRALFF